MYQVTKIKKASQVDDPAQPIIESDISAGDHSEKVKQQQADAKTDSEPETDKQDTSNVFAKIGYEILQKYN